MSSKNPLFKALDRKIHYLDADHALEVEKAFEIARKSHESQKRDTGEPYITHPVAVACILADLRMDHQTLVAALLHDTLEDTTLTKAEIVQDFGFDVAMLVDGVSKLTNFHFDNKIEAKAEYFRKMFLAVSKDVRVIIIKLADRLHNMRTIYGKNHKKIASISRETLDIYVPIARRLGMTNICLELEDLGFKSLYPMRFAVLKAAVNKTQGDHTNYLQEVIAQIQNKFNAKKLAIVSLSAREKHLYSIYKKMRNKRIPFSDINDVYGVRVVVANKEDCYLALCYIHEIFLPIFGKFKDYIAIPKSNGYMSLHTVLIGLYGNHIEVQIRTKKMCENAEIGLCSHWVYKARKSKINQQEIRAQQWIRSLLDIQQQTGNSADFIENVKVNLVPKDIYVFTPKGEIVELPSGSTIIDLAYAIHTEIGHTCVAAKVDKQLVPLSSVLFSGVTVEIITSPTALPNLSYLSFVVTAKARNSIKSYFKHKKRDQAILLGTKLIESALPNPLLDYDDKLKEKVVKALGCKNIRDLLTNVGLGFLQASRVIELFTSKNLDALASDGAIPISGIEGLVMTYATCCYPIPGDPVNAYMLKDHGVILHHTSCKNQDLTMQRIPVYWSGMVVGSFKSAIMIYTENKQGLLATLAITIAEQKSSIEDIKIVPSSASTTDVYMVIMVNNRQHLSEIFRKLRMIKQVYRVKRNNFGDIDDISSNR